MLTSTHNTGHLWHSTSSPQFQETLGKIECCNALFLFMASLKHMLLAHVVSREVVVYVELMFRGVVVCPKSIGGCIKRG